MIRTQAGKILFFLILAALVTVLLIPGDPANYQWIKAHKNNENFEMAQMWSFWGDFTTGVVPVLALIFLVGCYRKKKRLWHRAALAGLLASTVAGIAANAIRISTGRTRPSAEFKKSDPIPAGYKVGDPIPYGFYGPRGSARYQGFPSGHTATAFGAASALSVVMPPIGIPCLGAAAMVAWSRIHLGRHYPSDLFLGAFIGSLAGWIMGTGARHSLRHFSRAAIRAKRKSTPREAETHGPVLVPGQPPLVHESPVMGAVMVAGHGKPASLSQAGRHAAAPLNGFSGNVGPAKNFRLSPKRRGKAEVMKSAPGRAIRRPVKLKNQSRKLSPEKQRTARLPAE